MTGKYTSFWARENNMFLLKYVFAKDIRDTIAVRQGRENVQNNLHPGGEIR